MHGTDNLILQLLLIFVSAKALGELFERLRLPGVLGELAAGITFGPYALGWIHPTETMHALAEIGAIFLLFNVGLETSPGDLIRVGKKALVVALAGIALPFLLGFGYMWLRGDATHQAVFVGAALVATSVGITARVLSDLGMLDSHIARIILGAAVIDDILGMVLLAIVTGLAGEGVRWVKMGILLAEAVGFALFMTFVAPRVVRRVRPKVESLYTRHAPLLLSLALCLLLSWASTKIGMAAIIGAFFAGLALADFAPEWDLRGPVHGITEFLAPVFFFSIGARLEIGLFRGEVLTAASIVSILAIVSKIAGCGLPLLREGWRNALTAGVGMMPRGEVALIVGLVGLNAGIVTQPVYAIVIFMTAVTTLLAPPLLRILLKPHSVESASA